MVVINHESMASLPSTPESSMLQDTLSCNKSYTSLNEADVMISQLPSRPSHHSLSRPNSVASLTGLDMPEPDEGMSGPIVTLMDVLKGGNVRTGALLNLIVLSLLLFATISDVAFRSSTSTKDPYYNYKQEVSGETQYPNFTSRGGEAIDGATRSNKLSGKNKKKKKKGLLGSAMIESVTEALSPILPFAGGVDLRRDENWKSWNSWLALWDGIHDSLSDSTSREEKVAAMVPRGGGQKNEKKHNENSSNNRKRPNFQTKPTLSTGDPFLSTEDIGQMTLEEVSLIFQYALSSGTKGMDKETFLKQDILKSTNQDLMVRAIEAVDKATTQSRGDGVIPALTSHDENVHEKGPLSTMNGYGDVDALHFCAAMRIFAEWRVLRQVPPGFKGYAVGMNLGHKDVVQNIVKIETAVHEWIEKRSMIESEEKSRRECLSDDVTTESCTLENMNVQPRSPTLRQLLQYEIDMNLHPTSKLPRLKEKTAAMGLLWVRRQLQYQTAIFSNVIDVPDVFPTIIDAVSGAYTTVYGHLHGWTVQKIFNYSFQSAPDADLIFRHMNPSKLEQVISAAKSGKIVEGGNTEEDIIENNDIPTSTTSETFDLQGSKLSGQTIHLKQNNNENPMLNFFSHIGSEWEKLTKHISDEVDKIGHQIGGEWDKIVCNISRVFENQNECKINGHKQMNTPRGGAETNSSQNEQLNLSNDELERYISREMADDARRHILIYLDIAVPLLHDLAGLFDEMNMDDPTKV